MQYSVIADTEVRVSRVSLGTASLHHLFSSKQRQHLLATAASVGICHFDTSPYYGYGLAESDLGAFIQGRRHEFTVTTKVGLYPFGTAAHGAMDVSARKVVGKFFPRVSAPEVDWSLQRAARSLESSLRRLRTDHVDFLFLHEPDISLLNTEEFLAWVEAEQSKGKVRHWGLAGLPMLLEPWVRASHALANVLQVKDSLSRREADFILGSGRTLQFTYGYRTSVIREGEVLPPEGLMRMALARNATGSVLVSTRKTERIREIAGVAG